MLAMIKQSHPSLIGKNELFDSHCHFDFDVFGEDHDKGEYQRQLLWQQCLSQGIKHLLIPGVEPSQWQKLSTICQKLQGIVMSVGVHPWWIENNGKNLLEERVIKIMENFVLKKECVAIGECGLDGVIDTSLPLQHSIFEKQLALACDLEKPLILHVRKKHNEIIKLLGAHRPRAGGIVHGFTGSIDLARRYCQLGFSIGVGGSITYPRANKTRETIKNIPIDSIVLETDAPDMPLYGFQGQANSPLKIIDVAKELALLRKESFGTICMQTTENAKRVFNL